MLLSMILDTKFSNSPILERYYCSYLELLIQSLYLCHHNKNQVTIKTRNQPYKPVD